MHNKQPFPFRGSRNNLPPVPHAPQVSFSSGMTSQQKYNSIVESVQISLAGRAQQSIKGCQMHPKASQKCRKCQTIMQEAVNARLSAKKQQNYLNQVCVKEEFILSEQMPEQIKLNTENPKSHLNQKLQSNLMSSQKYKNLRQLKSVKEALAELSHDQIPISAYRAGTNEDPSDFMVTLFRIIELKPTKPQLLIMLRGNNVNVRALGLIYVRLAVDFEHVYAFLKASFGDNKLINAMMTVGELAERLAGEEGMDVGGIRMPRLPTRIQKAMDRKILESKSLGNEGNQLDKGVYGLEGVKRIEEVGERVRDERSRSRERKRERSESSSSSSSSNSSSSSSSSQSSGQSGQQLKLQKNQKQQRLGQFSQPSSKQIPKPAHHLLKYSNEGGNQSIADIRSRIQQSLKEQEEKQLKRKILEQKYRAQERIEQEDEKEDFQQSDSVEKYQMN